MGRQGTEGARIHEVPRRRRVLLWLPRSRALCLNGPRLSCHACRVPPSTMLKVKGACSIPAPFIVRTGLPHAVVHCASPVPQRFCWGMTTDQGGGCSEHRRKTSDGRRTTCPWAKCQPQDNLTLRCGGQGRADQDTHPSQAFNFGERSHVLRAAQLPGLHSVCRQLHRSRCCSSRQSVRRIRNFHVW
jgi:hypothetical protein